MASRSVAHCSDSVRMDAAGTDYSAALRNPRFYVGGSANFRHARDVAICNARYVKEWMALCYPHRGPGVRAHQVLRQRSVRLSRVLKLDLTALNEL